MIKILDAESPGFERELERLRAREGLISPEVIKQVQEIIESVRTDGDAALIRFADKFDHIRMRAEDLILPKSKLRAAASRADKKLMHELEKTIFNITAFHKRQIERSWEYTPNGATLGQRIVPLETVGIYVPGGKAAYPSTLLMNAIPAKIAGVKRIVVATPPQTFNENPIIAAALVMLNLHEVYLVGGAQAIAAMAYGTETVPRVDKIVGPGNVYVATAKRIVFGQVDIDMIAGPTEIVIVSDTGTNPRFIAADMISQAEHDESASAICITDSEPHAVLIKKEIQRQLVRLPRRQIARKALQEHGAIIVAPSSTAAADIVNRIAPEHVEVMVENPEPVAQLIRNAGAIFLGKYTPQAVGDYFAGPNHVLPTGGTARFFSPLGVYDFIKRISIIKYTKEKLRQTRGTIERLAQAEGLAGHAYAVSIRFEGEG